MIDAIDGLGGHHLSQPQYWRGSRPVRFHAASLSWDRGGHSVDKVWSSVECGAHSVEPKILPPTLSPASRSSPKIWPLLQSTTGSRAEVKFSRSLRVKPLKSCFRTSPFTRRQEAQIWKSQSSQGCLPWWWLAPSMIWHPFLQPSQPSHWVPRPPPCPPLPPSLPCWHQVQKPQKVARRRRGSRPALTPAMPHPLPASRLLPSSLCDPSGQEGWEDFEGYRVTKWQPSSTALRYG